MDTIGTLLVVAVLVITGPVILGFCGQLLLGLLLAIGAGFEASGKRESNDD